MSDEFESTHETSYSPFWPLLVLVLGLLAWSGYQVFATNSQRVVYDKQFQSAMPTITEAQNVSTRYVAMMKDLVATAQKDAAAADIVRAAITSGMIHVQPNSTNAPDASATPPPAASK